MSLGRFLQAPFNFKTNSYKKGVPTRSWYYLWCLYSRRLGRSPNIDLRKHRYCSNTYNDMSLFTQYMCQLFKLVNYWSSQLYQVLPRRCTLALGVVLRSLPAQVGAYGSSDAGAEREQRAQRQVGPAVAPRLQHELVQQRQHDTEHL